MDDRTRYGLEGVDRDEDAVGGLRGAVRRKVRAAWLLLRDPAGWSARRYQRKDSMELTALHPERWREDER